MRTASVLSTFLLALPSAFAIDYIVRNACPAPIEWFAGVESQGTLATGESALRTNQGVAPGFIYTSANGGLVNGNLVAARAGFFFEVGYPTSPVPASTNRSPPFRSARLLVLLPRS